MGKFKKPVFDEVTKCYRIQWSDMAYLTESILVDKIFIHEVNEYYTLPKEDGLRNVTVCLICGNTSVMEHVYKVAK